MKLFAGGGVRRLFFRQPNACMSGLELVDRQMRGGCKGCVANKAIHSGSWHPAELVEGDRPGCQIFHKFYQAQEIIAWADRRKRSIPSDRKLVDFGVVE